MNLAKIKANREGFLDLVKSARETATGDVRVNSGIRTAEDVEAIIDNNVTETPDWQPIYKYAAEFD